MASPEQIKPEIVPGKTVVEFKDKYGKTCNSVVRDVCRVKRIGQLTSVLVFNSIKGYEYISPKRFKVVNEVKEKETAKVPKSTKKKK